MFRVRDTQNDKWVTTEDVFVNPIGDVFSVKRKGFFKKREELVFESHYIPHKDTSIRDKNDIMIYEGDFVRAVSESDDNEDVMIGLVAYAPEKASYLLLVWSESQAYHIGDGISESLEVVGNIFDTPELAEYMDECEDVKFGGLEIE